MPDKVQEQLWIRGYQIKRRNLSTSASRKNLLEIGKLYNLTKNPNGGDRKSVATVATDKLSGQTSLSLAKQMGVGESTIRKYAKLVEKITKLARGLASVDSNSSNNSRMKELEDRIESLYIEGKASSETIIGLEECCITDTKEVAKALRSDDIRGAYNKILNSPITLNTISKPPSVKNEQPSLNISPNKISQSVRDKANPNLADKYYENKLNAKPSFEAPNVVESTNFQASNVEDSLKVNSQQEQVIDNNYIDVIAKGLVNRNESNYYKLVESYVDKLNSAELSIENLALMAQHCKNSLVAPLIIKALGSTNVENTWNKLYGSYKKELAEALVDLEKGNTPTFMSPPLPKVKVVDPPLSNALNVNEIEERKNIALIPLVEYLERLYKCNLENLMREELIHLFQRFAECLEKTIPLIKDI